MTGLRVLSYNIRSLRDERAAVVEVIGEVAADLVCLQEVPRFFGQRGRVRWLARRTGTRLVRGRREAGLAVLAGPAVRVVGAAYHLLSPVAGLHRRGLAVAEVEVGGVRLVAASTHLDLADEPRQAHVREMLGLLGRYEVPVVLAGDVNEQPGGAAWNLLTATLRDAHAVAPWGESPTFSAARPSRRIDGIFVGPEFTVLRCGVPPDPGHYARATDHRPVVADLTLR